MKAKALGRQFFMTHTSLNHASTTKLGQWLESPLVTRFILCVIIFNAIILGFETSKVAMGNFGGLLLALDTLCLAIFVVEIALKLLAYRHRFFYQRLEHLRFRHCWYCTDPRWRCAGRIAGTAYFAGPACCLNLTKLAQGG